MEAALVACPYAETIATLESAVLRKFTLEDNKDLTDSSLQPSMHALSIDISYHRMLRELRQELLAVRHAMETLNAHNIELRHQLNEARQKEIEARDHACRDELTGLPNRRLLKDRLQQAMVQADRQKKQVAILLIDLDGFKAINDTFGHAAGDQLLRAVAQRLSTCIRASDTACRYGGDEFIVVMPELDGQEAFDAATNKVRACMEAPYVICGREVTVGASIGCAAYPADGQSYQDLIGRADAAMYHIKAQRKQHKQRNA